MANPSGGLKNLYKVWALKNTRTTFKKAYTQTVLFIHIFQYKIVRSQDEDSRGSYSKKKPWVARLKQARRLLFCPRNRTQTTLRAPCARDVWASADWKSLHMVATVSPKSKKILLSVTRDTFYTSTYLQFRQTVCNQKLTSYKLKGQRQVILLVLLDYL